MQTEKYKIIGGIKVFHSAQFDHDDYHAQGLENLYHAEEKHFWFISRKKFIYQMMSKYIHFDAKVIEVGAGTGNVSHYLLEQGYKDVSVGEMHFNGLRYAKQQYGIKECLQFDLFNAPYVDEYDVVCMFDVIEHIADENAALKKIYQMLKTDGKIVLTVPAHMWLWNREDAIAGHKRRYSKKYIKQILVKNGFEIVEIKFFFIFITPLLFLRTVLHKDSGKAISSKEYHQEISISPILNTLLLYLSSFENKISRWLPNVLGGSLFVIARKK